jgi:hypothetical protein
MPSPSHVPTLVVQILTKTSDYFIRDIHPFDTFIILIGDSFGTRSKSSNDYYITVFTKFCHVFQCFALLCYNDQSSKVVKS